ncbi:hypothetical protein WJX73_008259, partial [Symbiochloris irregularis]
YSRLYQEVGQGLRIKSNTGNIKSFLYISSWRQSAEWEGAQQSFSFAFYVGLRPLQKWRSAARSWLLGLQTWPPLLQAEPHAVSR